MLCKMETDSGTRLTATPIAEHLLHPMQTVAVVITVNNQAHHLDNALRSVLIQTRKADEIFVIDMESDDQPESVTSTHPNVIFQRSLAGNLAAARNQALNALASEKVIFIEA